MDLWSDTESKQWLMHSRYRPDPELLHIEFYPLHHPLNPKGLYRYSVFSNFGSRPLLDSECNIQWLPALTLRKEILHVDWLSLVGDSVDNIPGATGIGIKTASTLLQQYGNLENIFGNIADPLYPDPLKSTR